MTQPELEQFLLSKIAAILQVPPEHLSVEEEFPSLGLNSVHAVSLTGDVEDLLGIQLDPSLVYEYPTVRSLSQALLDLPRPS